MIAVSSHTFPLLFSSSSPLLRFQSSSTRPSFSMASMARPQLDFPFLPPSDRDLMLNLIATIDNGLGSALLPSNVPPDVLRFQNAQGTAHGSLNIRSGSQSSPVDFVLESWLNCKIPGAGGGDLNIATLFAFLNSSTDAPHLLLELIRNTPTSILLIIDLLPRRDLVLHPDYLHKFYQHTNLDSPRQQLHTLPHASPYYSPSLFIRSVLSPTAVAVVIESGKEEEEEEIVAERIGGAAEKIVRVWLENCEGGGELGEGERVEMERRDGLIKRKAVEIDLAANLPRMFGAEVAERVVAEIQKVFRV